MNSNNLGNIRALMSGVESTPYEHGLYLFDIILPTNYPAEPPVMKILTTGNGVVRFNPNLYNNGFVCLSVINTWGGAPEERWNSAYSTLLQIFLSVQALVMDNNILQKEPGFDKYDTNSIENKTYGWIVRYGNMKYAMIENLKNPPLGFEKIVKKHFSVKKNEILRICEEWVEESKNAEFCFDCNLVALHNRQTIAWLLDKGPYNAFLELFNELAIELEKLPQY